MWALSSPFKPYSLYQLLYFPIVLIWHHIRKPNCSKLFNTFGGASLHTCSDPAYKKKTYYYITELKYWSMNKCYIVFWAPEKELLIRYIIRVIGCGILVARINIKMIIYLSSIYMGSWKNNTLRVSRRIKLEWYFEGSQKKWVDERKTICGICGCSQNSKGKYWAVGTTNYWNRPNTPARSSILEWRNHQEIKEIILFLHKKRD